MSELAVAPERPQTKTRSRLRSGYTRSLDSAGYQVVAVVIGIVGWQIASLIAGPRYVPSPAATVSRLADFSGGGFALDNLAPTLIRVGGGFVVALTVGVLVGSIMGLYRRGEQLLELGVAVALTIPSLCYIIVAFLWFGLNERATIFAIGVSTFPIVAINVWQGVKAIDTRLMDMARVFGVGARERMRRVVLPQILPYIMAAARYGFGVSWKVAIFVELMGRSDGVGYQLNYSFQIFDMPGVFAWTLMFTLVMMGIELLIFKPIERYLFRWRPEMRA